MKPAPPSLRADIPIGRRELVLWAGAFLLFNNILANLIAPHDADLGLRWVEESRFGGFDALGWGVALWRLSRAAPRQARLGEGLLIVCLCLIGGLRPPLAVPLALTALGFWMIREADVEIRAAAAVFLALASHQLWSHVLFKLVSPEMIKLDAMLVGGTLNLLEKGVQWRGDLILMPSGWSVAIIEGCSSFASVSAALLAWVSLAKLERTGWVRRDLWVAAAAAAAQIGCNVIRLGLVAQSLPMYLYWHEGAGAQIYVTTASAMAVLIAILGTRWAARAR